MSNSIYSASDKAFFDALNHPKITKHQLHEMFLSRGILVSKKTNRRKLASYFSSFTHSYSDYSRLSSILGSASRREKQSVCTLNGVSDSEIIENALRNVKNELVDKHQAVGRFKKVGENFHFKINYRTIDFNKSEFKQVVEREIEIELEKDNGSYNLRTPHSDFSNLIKVDIIEALRKELEQEISVHKIELPAGALPEERTNFFNKLVNEQMNFELHDVTDVFVYQPKEIDSEDDEIDEDSLNTDLGIHISKASLKGENVQLSEELKKLLEKGFYIYRIIWQAKDTEVPDSDIYEFECMFSNPDECTDFSYLIRGHYKYKGNREYNVSKVQCSKSEERALGKNVEHSAQRIIDELWPNN